MPRQSLANIAVGGPAHLRKLGDIYPNVKGVRINFLLICFGELADAIRICSPSRICDNVKAHLFL